MSASESAPEMALHTRARTLFTVKRLLGARCVQRAADTLLRLGQEPSIVALPGKRLKRRHLRRLSASEGRGVGHDW